MITFFTIPAISEEKKQTTETSEIKQQPPEKFPIAGERYNIVTDRKMTKIDDVDEHYIMITEYKGVNSKSKGLVFSTVISDTIKGNGTFFAYIKGVMLDGGTYYGQAEGKITTVLSPSGKPVTTVNGTWVVPDFQMGGNSYVMDGISTSRGVGPGISKMQIKGEGRLKKK